MRRERSRSVVVIMDGQIRMMGLHWLIKLGLGFMTLWDVSMDDGHARTLGTLTWYWLLTARRVAYAVRISPRVYSAGLASRCTKGFPWT
jgi:hypothetical protein